VRRFVTDVDPDRVRELVTNLLTNALRHSPAGAAVEVAVERRRGGARISVRDHGPGVDAADAERIFRRFGRGGRSAGGGTGLGLFIVQTVVEAHGGTVTVGAAEGGGARFVVTLPVS
jgi:two-component system OmpR family sensor kinase